MPKKPPPSCGNHPDRAAVSRCRSCGRALCGECFRFFVDDAPACAACAFTDLHRERRRTSLAVTFVVLACGLSFLFAQKTGEVGIAVFAGVSAVILGGAGWLTTRSARPPNVREREPDEAPLGDEALAPAAHPYRGRLRRAALAAAPRVSATAVVGIVLASLGLAAVAAPAALDLPRWIEAEVAVGIFTLLFAGVLATLLYRGYRLKDDFTYFAPWNRAPVGAGKSSHGSSKSGCDFGAAGCELGAVEGIGVILLLGVALLGAFLLVELVVPVAFLVFYGLIVRAIGAVAHDRHDCKDDLVRSVGWGLAWSALFSLPIAITALGVGAFLAAR
jgi:hypothetical protein